MILDLYWARNESAVGKTAEKYGAYCLAIAGNILQNRADAEECVNDTYLKAWEAIPPQRPQILGSFLGRITRNLALNKYKEQRTQKHGGGEVALLLSELEDCIPSASSVEGEYESQTVVEAIKACLHSLSGESRNVFIRRYWYADPVKEIAARFEMSESKVKSLLFRARKTLKNHLEKEGVIL